MALARPRREPANPRRLESDEPLEFIKQCTGCAQIDCISPSLNQPSTGASTLTASSGRPCWRRRRAKLIAPRSSHDFAFCRRATSMPFSVAASASLTVPAPASNASPLELVQLQLQAALPRLLDRSQPNGDRRKCGLGPAYCQLSFGLQYQENIVARHKTDAVHRLDNLRQSLLSLACDAERPPTYAQAERVPVRDTLLLADLNGACSIIRGH